MCVCDRAHEHVREEGRRQDEEEEEEEGGEGRERVIVTTTDGGRGSREGRRREEKVKVWRTDGLMDGGGASQPISITGGGAAR